MSMNLYDIELAARARHRELLQEAERRRMLKQALAGRPRRRPAIGEWLRQWFRRPEPQAQIPCVQVSC